MSKQNWLWTLILAGVGVFAFTKLVKAKTPSPPVLPPMPTPEPTPTLSPAEVPTPTYPSGYKYQELSTMLAAATKEEELISIMNEVEQQWIRGNISSAELAKLQDEMRARFPVAPLPEQMPAPTPVPVPTPITATIVLASGSGWEFQEGHTYSVSVIVTNISSSAVELELEFATKLDSGPRGAINLFEPQLTKELYKSGQSLTFESSFTIPVGTAPAQGHISGVVRDTYGNALASQVKPIFIPSSEVIPSTSFTIGFTIVNVPATATIWQVSFGIYNPNLADTVYFSGPEANIRNATTLSGNLWESPFLNSSLLIVVVGSWPAWEQKFIQPFVPVPGASYQIDYNASGGWAEPATVTRA